MKTGFICLALSVLAVGCSTTRPQKQTDWVGEVAVGTGDQYFHNVGWLDDIELGLREDGVMVWRRKP